MKSKYWNIGIGIGTVAGLLVAAIMTSIDWRKNPSGIFHGPQGTDWTIVRETAISWFLPIAPTAAGLLLLVLYAWKRDK